MAMKLISTSQTFLTLASFNLCQGNFSKHIEAPISEHGGYFMSGFVAL